MPIKTITTITKKLINNKPFWRTPDGWFTNGHWGIRESRAKTTYAAEDVKTTMERVLGTFEDAPERTYAFQGLSHRYAPIPGSKNIEWDLWFFGPPHQRKYLYFNRLYAPILEAGQRVMVGDRKQAIAIDSLDKPIGVVMPARPNMDKLEGTAAKL